MYRKNERGSILVLSLFTVFIAFACGRTVSIDPEKTGKFSPGEPGGGDGVTSGDQGNDPETGQRTDTTGDGGVALDASLETGSPYGTECFEGISETHYEYTCDLARPCSDVEYRKTGVPSSLDGGDDASVGPYLDV